MSSAYNQPQTFPIAPPSPSAGGHEMRDYYAAHEVARPPLQSSSHPLPYLDLQARLSQVWINRWTILLLLVLVRTLLAIASLDDNLTSARHEALSACTSVENVGSAMASMPHYLSDGVNELSAHGIEKAINGLMHMLTLSVTGVEEIVVFFINLLISTYVCLITFAVGGTLHMAIDVAENVGGFLNSTAKDIGGDLGKAVDGFQDILNGFVADIDKVGDFLTGKNTSPPKIDLTGEISRLNSLQLPVGYDQGLTKLNASIPTFADVKNFTDNAIRLPFEEVKKLLNQSLPRYTLDRSLFPVPAKDQLTFCSDNNGINDFFDDLVKIEHIVRKIFLGVLLTAAILACIPMAYREVRRWRMQQEKAQLARAEAVNTLDAVYIVSRPYTAGAGLTLANKCASPRRKAAIRFTIAYATTVPALFVLSLGIAGLFACLCQYILLKSIEKEVPALTNQVGAFADKVVASLNNASMQWAVGTNDIINSTNTHINDDVFGWVNTTTSALNTTLNVFVDGMMLGLNVTFGGTPLYEPVLDVLDCLVLLKIQGIEKALTWVTDNAYISFPTMPVDTFSLGAVQKISQNGNSSLLATSPATDASDEISSAIIKVVSKIESAIRQEAIISSCILVIWLIIVIVGLAHAGYFLVKSGKGSSDGTSQSRHVDRLFVPEKTEDTTQAPTYEQAIAKSGSHGYDVHVKTSSPKPLPTFKVDLPDSSISADSYELQGKLGKVESQHVGSATHRPYQIRSSSHGNVVVATPIEPVPSSEVFHYPPQSQDPFADPR